MIYEIDEIPSATTFKVGSDIKIPQRVYSILNANVNTGDSTITFAEPHNFLLGEKLKYDSRDGSQFYFLTDLTEIDN